MDAVFQPVALTDLKDCFKDLNFDLYLLMPNGKYLKAFDRTTGLDFARLAAYQAKGVTHFHIHDHDMTSFNDHLTRSPMQTLTNPGQPLTVRQRAFLAVMEQSLFESFSQGSPTKDNITRTFEALRASLKGDRDFIDTLSLLLKVCPTDDLFLRHAISTAIYSYIIATSNRLTSERSLKIILFAALFHDIGRMRLREGHRLLHQNQTAEDIAEYEKHPLLSLEVLRGPLPFADEEIRTCILQHRERLDGKGFPHGVKGSSMYNLARIIAIGDTLSELTLGMVDGKYYTKAQAVAVMMADEGHFDRKLLTPFAQLILQGQRKVA